MFSHGRYYIDETIEEHIHIITLLFRTNVLLQVKMIFPFL